MFVVTGCLLFTRARGCANPSAHEWRVNPSAYGPWLNGPPPPPEAHFTMRQQCKAGLPHEHLLSAGTQGGSGGSSSRPLARVPWTWEVALRPGPLCAQMAQCSAQRDSVQRDPL